MSDRTCNFDGACLYKGVGVDIVFGCGCNYVGIDLGLKGAIVIIDKQGNHLQSFDMPTIKVTTGKKKKNEVDLPNLKNIINNNINYNDYVIIEKTQAVPSLPGKITSSPQANHSLGFLEGFVTGILSQRNVRHELQLPSVWQRYYGIRGKGKDTKVASYKIASKIFPQMVFHTIRGRMLDGRADAVLLAEWARRRLTNE